MLPPSPFGELHKLCMSMVSSARALGPTTHNNLHVWFVRRTEEKERRGGERRGEEGRGGERRGEEGRGGERRGEEGRTC